jgi:hypothetical protein
MFLILLNLSNDFEILVTRRAIFSFSENSSLSDLI